ncbi:type II toxin-antitoxin system RelB/DinJ family antitoxin [Eubacterium barkeri]|uniref:RelB antitoxin n=1 Tax=Eubacterium barkeri TaxID=1528 RepID=A0A1H3FIW8_EUBBA|nr:type II toxin-antitoxin system RelB/DinJ family antitoxin [Eubacterium barkeri]SDX90308.1 RelB antitoxin [Eubacterium barkeri]
MRETTNINLRIEKSLKAQAEALFSEFGMNMTTAMTVFLRQAVREQAIPFRIAADVKPTYPNLPVDMDAVNQYTSHEEYVDAKLAEASLLAAEDPMRYSLSDLDAFVQKRLEDYNG